MTYRDFDDLSSGQGGLPLSDAIKIEGPLVELPDAAYVRDAMLQRDGMDLVLDGPDGRLIIESYFSTDFPPDLAAPDGATLTPTLVNSFVRSAPVYAQAHSETDASPVGAVAEVSGEANVLRTDGSTQKIVRGTPIYEGDVIETGSDGAVNIHFVDDTSFAVSGDARLAIDEYVYDPATQSGEQGFSVLKGLFVFTSGLIGRDDPDDVRIDTPTGSIGIRGTIIAGNASTGEITLVEGAIVVRDLAGNEVSLAAQFETAQIVPGEGVRNLGQIAADDVFSRFSGISVVAPALFSSIEDTIGEQRDVVPGDADRAADQNGDNQVDGSAGTETMESVPVEEAPIEEKSEPLLPSTDDSRAMLGLDPFGSYSGLEPLGGAGLLDPYASLSAESMPLSPLPLPPSQTYLKAGTNDPSSTTTGDNILPPPPPSLIATSADDPPVHIRTAFSGAQMAQHNVAPLEYFMAAEGQAWSYNFGKEFINTDIGAGDVLTYHLSAVTKTYLTNAVGAEGTGWTFDASTGMLSIASGNVIATDESFNIEVLARDSAGQINAGGFQSYAFNLWDGPISLGGTINSNGQNYADTANANNAGVSVGDSSLSTDNRIFTGGGNDSLNIWQGKDNIVNLGAGDDSINIFPDTNNTGNIVIGGDGKDVYTTSVAQNRFFGMGGDDKAVIDLANTSLMGALNTAGNTGILMDLGDSGFKAGSQLVSNGVNYKFGGDNSGYGDTLYLGGSGARTLDFRNIDDHYLRSVERIDARSSGLDVHMYLNYQDVIEMTDYKNTLIFRVNSGDQIDFSGSAFGAFTKVRDNITLDDNYDGGGASVNFDVYSDGNVTLVIEDNGASVSGIPGL